MQAAKLSHFPIINPLIAGKLLNNTCECPCMKHTNLLIFQSGPDTLALDKDKFFLGNLQVCYDRLEQFPICCKGFANRIDRSYRPVP